METASDFVKVPGGTLHVRRTHTSGKPSLVGLHGYHDTGGTYTFILPQLAPHFDLTLPDWRGHGKSSRLESGYYSAALLIGDLSIVTDSIPKPYVLMGHSMGAAVAARFAGIFPEEISALILLEGFSGVTPPEDDIHRMQEWGRTLRRAAKKDKPPSSKKMENLLQVELALQRVHPRLSTEKVKILAREFAHEQDGGFVWHPDPEFRSRFAPIPFPPEVSRALWRRVNCPVLFLYGSESHLLPGRPGTEDSSLDEILSHFSDVESISVPGAGHNLQHDQPEFVAEKIVSFLERRL